AAYVAHKRAGAAERVAKRLNEILQNRNAADFVVDPVARDLQAPSNNAADRLAYRASQFGEAVKERAEAIERVDTIQPVREVCYPIRGVLPSFNAFIVSGRQMGAVRAICDEVVVISEGGVIPHLLEIGEGHALFGSAVRIMVDHILFAGRGVRSVA